MTVKGVKLKSESLFSISCGILELRRKNLRVCPPSPDRVKAAILLYQSSLEHKNSVNLEEGQ